MEENKNALDEINKGCTIAIEAINNLIVKVDNKKLKKLLQKQLKCYDKIEDKINKIYNNYSEEDPHEIGSLTKVMTNYMSNIKIVNDNTDSKIVEILLQGTNMGIIEGRRILNNKKLDKKVINLLNEFISQQEIIGEELKKYL
ncbi:MAG: hypothetical protein PHX19_04125 [Bacilli bacterium]|nr:hypothetical protein [Bacilli bacterium]MDD4408213.1 hypothetical protein [Bacilli bacterium]